MTPFERAALTFAFFAMVFALLTAARFTVMERRIRTLEDTEAARCVSF